MAETQLVEALPPAPGVAIAPQMIESMKKMHDTKVRGLLNSIHMLKQQLLVAKAASREHRRSQLIQALKGHIKDNEKVIDVLREALVDRGLEEQQVNDLVIKKTLTGPARFRPKTREEYAKECVDLTAENRKLSKKLERAKAIIIKGKAAAGAAPNPLEIPSRGAAAPAAATTTDLIEENPGSTLASLASPQDDEMAIENGQRVSDLQEEVATLRTSLAGKQRVMAEQAREMERLQQGEREARRAAERSDAQRHKYRELKDAYRDQHSRFTLAMTEKESLSSQLRAKTEELRVTHDTAEVRIKAKEEECFTRMGDLKDAIEREGELQQELEAERRMGASEKMRFKNDLQQRLAAEKKLEDGLSSATGELDGLRAQVAELQKEASGKGKVETELSNVMVRLRDSNGQKTETRKELDELRAKHEDTKKESTEWEARYNESKEHFDKLAREADRLKDDLKKKVEELTEEKQRVADGKNELKSKELQAKQAADQLKLDAEKKEMEHVRRANERDSKLKEEKEQALVELKKTRQEHATEKAQLEEKLQAAEAAREAAAAKARDLDLRGQTAMKSEEELQSSVHELQAAKDKLESSLAAAEKAVADKQREVDTLKGEVEASEKKIAELTARCDEEQARANKFADGFAEHVMTMNQSQQMSGASPMGVTPSAVGTPTSGGAAPSRSDLEVFDAGTLVEANYKGLGEYYGGEVVRDNGDGTYEIQYLEGVEDSESGKPADEIRSLSADEKRELKVRIEQWELRKEGEIGSAAPPRSEAGRLEEGMRVEADYKDKGRYYEGRISRDNGDGTYDIEYDDGDKEFSKPADAIQILEEEEEEEDGEEDGEGDEGVAEDADEGDENEGGEQAEDEDGAGGQDIENEQNDIEEHGSKASSELSDLNLPNEGDDENNENDVEEHGSKASSELSDLNLPNEGDDENNENDVEEHGSKASSELSDLNLGGEGGDQDAGGTAAEAKVGGAETGPKGQNQDDENLSASSEISDLGVQNANAPSHTPAVAGENEEGREGGEEDDEEDDEEGSHSHASSSLSDLHDAYLDGLDDNEGGGEDAGQKKSETATKNET